MKLSPTKSHAGRPAFTLIELLVVIAIIAILAAILFPVFARARENARRSSCQSNLKQMALGVLQYNQDYDQFFPLHTNSNSSGPWTATHIKGWADAIQPYVKSTQILKCPSATGTPSDDPGTSGYTQYYYNLRLSWDPFTNTVKANQEASLSRTSQTILFGDSINGSAAQATLGCEITGANGCRADGLAMLPDTRDTAPSAPRHLEGHNFAFCDGHVKWFKLEGNPINSSGSVGFPIYYYLYSHIHNSNVLQSLSANDATFAIKE